MWTPAAARTAFQLPKEPFGNTIPGKHRISRWQTEFKPALRHVSRMRIPCRNRTNKFKSCSRPLIKAELSQKKCGSKQN